MEIILNNLGKKYLRQWIFRELQHTFIEGEPTAVTGPNGSGKSTLLKIISGWLLPTTGTIAYRDSGKIVPNENIFRNIDLVAPYTELIEELTLQEFLSFHFSFKQIRSDLTIAMIMDLIFLTDHAGKYIRNFSSGMKQRLKLGLGLFSKTPVLLLDEPTTNLDAKGKEWYNSEIVKIINEKLIIIASNQPEEFNFTKNKIQVGNYTRN